MHTFHVTCQGCQKKFVWRKQTMSNTTSLGAIENKTDKRKSFLGKALTIKTGGSKAVNIHLNSSDVVEVFLQPKDTLREALKMVETQRGVKLDPGVYQFKGDSGIVVNMATPAKSLTGNDLFLAPPVNVSESMTVVMLFFTTL